MQDLHGSYACLPLSKAVCEPYLDIITHRRAAPQQSRNHQRTLAMAILDNTARSTGMGTGLFATAFAALSDWNDARITRNALHRLSARELDDIGLCHGDIDAIARRGNQR